MAGMIDFTPPLALWAAPPKPAIIRARAAPFDLIKVTQAGKKMKGVHASFPMPTFIPKGGLVVSYVGSNAITTNLSAYTFTAQSFGASGKKLVVVGAATDSNISTTRTLSSLTIAGGGNQAVLNTYGAAGGTNITTLYYLETTATFGDVVVTLSGAMLYCGISIWTITGYSSTTPITTNSAAQTGSTANNVSINVLKGDAIIGLDHIQQTSARTTTWVGLTENFDGAIETNQGYRAPASLLATADATPLSITATPSSTIARHGTVVASWR